MTYKANTMNITLSCMPIAFAGLTNTSKEYSIHTVVPRETGLKRNQGGKNQNIFKEPTSEHPPSDSFTLW